MDSIHALGVSPHEKELVDHTPGPPPKLGAYWDRQEDEGPSAGGADTPISDSSMSLFWRMGLQSIATQYPNTQHASQSFSQSGKMRTYICIPNTPPSRSANLGNCGCLSVQVVVGFRKCDRRSHRVATWSSIAKSAWPLGYPMWAAYIVLCLQYSGRVGSWRWTWLAIPYTEVVGCGLGDLGWVSWWPPPWGGHNTKGAGRILSIL